MSTAEKPVKSCDHRRVYFGSGAFYIFCRDCSHRWVCDEKKPQGDMACECSARPNPPPLEA